MSAGKRTILVTGGAGFIGSAVCRHLVASGRWRVINVDKLTYAGNPASLAAVESSPDYRFYRADICSRADMSRILAAERVDLLMHLAAESHVDRSIAGPDEAIRTNIVGTFSLLEAAREHWRGLAGEKKRGFRFHHVSTDEVFGDLEAGDPAFTEGSPYRPSSPYSSSKAAADHLVRAWHRTYGLPVILSNCSNNYGPFQHPEKLIPRTILNALEGEAVSVYGTGDQVRDWLHVADHVRALELISTRGEIGETYLVGARAERTNRSVVEAICDLLDARRPLPDGRCRRSLIALVPDRPGHDRRYAIDPSRIEERLGWRARHSFEPGLADTVDWYLANEAWWRPLHGKCAAAAPASSAA
jgi:dTDP-glucose 4,6-dehydratase